MRVNHHTALCVLGQHRQRSIVHGIAEGFVRGRSFIAFPDLGKDLPGEAALLGKGAHSEEHRSKYKYFFHIDYWFSSSKEPARAPGMTDSRPPIIRPPVLRAALERLRVAPSFSSLATFFTTLCDEPLSRREDSP